MQKVHPYCIKHIDCNRFYLNAKYCKVSTKTKEEMHSFSNDTNNPVTLLPKGESM